MNLRPPRAQQRLPPRGEPCDRRHPATSEATVAHGKPYAAADMLRGPARPPPPSAAPASLRRSRPTAPPTPQTAPPSSCPSNKFDSSLFAHNFSLNYYNTINKISKAHHLAWHQQVCHPAIRRGSGAFLCERGVSPLRGFTPSLWVCRPLRGLDNSPRHRGLWSLRRGKPTAQPRLEAKGRGGFDESTPTQGSATATTPRRALRPPPPGHKRSERGPRQALRRRTRSRGPPAPRYPPPRPPYHPATSLSAHQISSMPLFLPTIFHSTITKR